MQQNAPLVGMEIKQNQDEWWKKYKKHHFTIDTDTQPNNRNLNEMQLVINAAQENELMDQTQ